MKCNPEKPSKKFRHSCQQENVFGRLRVTVTKRASLHSLFWKTTLEFAPQFAALRSAAPRVESLVVPPRLYVLLPQLPSLFSGGVGGESILYKVVC
jgi:hypothetical protein